MIKQKLVLLRKLTGVLVLFFCMASCSTISYYSQSVVGHSRLMLARMPVDKVIEQADDRLKAQLLMSKELRAFSVAELGLPSSQSYQTYVYLARDFPVWTIVAAPEFSLNAKQWCYPVIGCATYRGYFSQSSANAYALTLESNGFETHVAGATAYSTLGWFADPLLPSMMRYGDTQFAETLFHEIAHQKLYINGDSDFNEAFASVVGETGVRRWLKAQRPDNLAAYEKSLKVQQQFYALVTSGKLELQAVYQSKSTMSQMRLEKRAVLQNMKLAYERLTAQHWGGESHYHAWFDGTPNNAKFAALSTYRNRVPELKRLLTECGENLPRFYRALASAEQLKLKVVIPLDCLEANDG